MPTQRGSLAKVGWQVETAFGTTPASPAGMNMPFISCGVGANQPLSPNPVMRGDRNAAPATRGRMDVSGDMVAPLDGIALGYWLKSTFGAPVTGSIEDTIYPHVFKVGTSQPSFLLEKQFSDASAYELLQGLKVSKLSFAWGGSGFAQCTVSIVGAKRTVGSASYDVTGSPTLTECLGDQFIQSEGTIKEGGSLSAIISEATLDIESDLDTDMYGSNGQRAEIVEGGVTVSGSITAFFQSTALVTKASVSTESSLELIWTKGVASFGLLVPELIYETSSLPIDTPKGIRLKMNYRGHYSNDAAASMVVATLRNIQASYA